MKNLYIAGIAILLVACTPGNQDKTPLKEDGIKTGKNQRMPTDWIPAVYNPENIESQFFFIDNATGDIITGRSGITMKIDKNTFVDETGQPVAGTVAVELKEALTSYEWVMGNLVTTYNGMPLQTGGMMYVHARSGDISLRIARDKPILVGVPGDTVMPGMSVFAGVKDPSGIRWVDPVGIRNPGPDSAWWMIDVFNKKTNIKYTVDGFYNADDAPEKVGSKVSEICWAGQGLRIRRDSTFSIEEYTVHFYKQKRLYTYRELLGQIPGENTFLEDKNIKYIFKIKNIGWSNIDKLQDDPRAEEVNLETIVENYEAFGPLYITLVTQNMYLQGYQKKDRTFAFSQGDGEPQRLPIGETATILATAYKGGKPFFALAKVTIRKSQKVSLRLEETDLETLKAKLSREI